MSEKELMGKINNMKEEEKKALVILYCLTRIQEMGLIENLGCSITESGFDGGHDLYKSGIKITEKDVYDVGIILGASISDAILWSEVIMKIQETGFDVFKKEINVLKEIHNI